MAIKVVYNDQVLATLEKGQKCTLKCNGKKMISDVVVMALKENAIPTDLTGYTISVPIGWSVGDLGTYTLYGILSYYSTGAVPIHNTYAFDMLSGRSTGIRFSDTAEATNKTLSSGAFDLEITGGSDTISSSLIQWFVDNDATFTKVEQQKTIYVYDINGGATYTFNVGNASTYGDITFPCYDVNGEKYLFLNADDNSRVNIYLKSSQVNRDVYHTYTGSLSNEVKITDSVENGVTLYCTSSGHSGGTTN